MKESFIIIFITIIIYLYFNYKKFENFALTPSKSGKKYLVANNEYKNEVADLLSIIELKMYKLRDYLYENRKTKKYVKNIKYIELLKKHLNKKRTKIFENVNDPDLTSYSVNKGEELVLCVRNKGSKKLQNINTMMYVVIHEMAHMGCPEIGHTPLFNKIFKFFLQTAIKLKIYKKEEYFTTRPNYCGMILSTNILND